MLLVAGAVLAAESDALIAWWNQAVIPDGVSIADNGDGTYTLVVVYAQRAAARLSVSAVLTDGDWHALVSGEKQAVPASVQILPLAAPTTITGSS